ncbi:MAG TPA: peptidoglycan-binding protein [Solirubrobacteraceae bacterium]|nr:peptidoglycan-binding protein [Solirubrobacteraceae bacterium]
MRVPPLKVRSTLRVPIVALAAVILLAGAGWVAAQSIKSPARIAADTAAPTPSLVTAAVERRSLATEVIVRGTGRYGKPQPITLPTSGLKTSTQVISRIAKPDRVLRERSVALTVSGRPVIVLRGATPMHRDIGPGDSGEDVRQLEQALRRLGYRVGNVDGRYDGATAAAVAQMYRDKDAAPFGLTEAQTDRLNTASALVGSTTDLMLQARLTLQNARRGATRGEVNQAQLDAETVAELIPPARAAITAARTRIAEATDLAKIAARKQKNGDGVARRDVALAEVEVTVKRNALADAMRAVTAASIPIPPDATEAEVAAARQAQREATARVPQAQAELDAAEAAARAAREVVRQAGSTAGDDGRRAKRDLALGQGDLREAQRLVKTLQRKYHLAVARVALLRKPPADTSAEAAIVRQATREVQRVTAEYNRLAARSGVQVPADEILFFRRTPVRVDSVTAQPGAQVSGEVMTVSNTTLAIDAGLSPQDRSLVKLGLPVRIEDPESGIDVRGKVTYIAPRPGTNPALNDPTRTAIEVTPEGSDQRLVNTSVRLTISIQSTEGKVLTVPLNALSVGGDGQSRVQVDAGGGRTRLVAVNPGLAAAGNVEVEPKQPGALKAGDRVVIGVGLSSAATRAPTGSQAPATPPGISTTPAPDPSGAGAAPATTTPATPAPATTTPAPATTTPDPAASGQTGAVGGASRGP